MAAPTAPTLVSITTEALKKAIRSTPSSTELTRAQNEWMEEVKNDIFTLSKKLRSLYTTSFAILDNGRHRYALPTDFSSDMTATLLDGEHTGTLQAGAAGTATLAAAETSTSDYAIGKYLLITSGTGKGSCSQITAYNTTTKVATVTPNFTTAPAASDGYMIVEVYYPLAQRPVWDLDNQNYPTSKDRPVTFFPTGDDDNGELLLYPVPDQTYGLQLRYYANLMKVDLTSTLMSTLYQRWRNVFTQGVLAKALQDKDDDKASTEVSTYNALLQALVMRETDGMDLHNLSMRVEY